MYTDKVQSHAKRKPYTRPAGPPLLEISAFSSDTHSHSLHTFAVIAEIVFFRSQLIVADSWKEKEVLTPERFPR